MEGGGSGAGGMEGGDGGHHLRTGAGRDVESGGEGERAVEVRGLTGRG